MGKYLFKDYFSNDGCKYTGKNKLEIVCDCDDVIMLHPISFCIGGTEFVLEAKKLFTEYDCNCVLNMEVNTKEDQWIIGNAFLFNYLSSFDMDDKTITLYSYNEILQGKINSINSVDMHKIIKGLSVLIIFILSFIIGILGKYKYKFLM